MDKRVVLTVVGMALLTYIPRAMPVVLLARTNMPKPIRQGLALLPPAILSALVAQQVFAPDGRPDFSWSNPALAPALVAGLVAWRTRSLAWTVVGGLVAAAAYRWLL